MVLDYPLKPWHFYLNQLNGCLNTRVSQKNKSCLKSCSSCLDLFILVQKRPLKSQTKIRQCLTPGKGPAWSGRGRTSPDGYISWTAWARKLYDTLFQPETHVSYLSYRGYICLFSLFLELLPKNCFLKYRLIKITSILENNIISSLDFAYILSFMKSSG